MVAPLLQSRDIGFSAALTPLQSQVDGFVGGFVDQAADWRSLAAMAAGGMAYRLGRIGTMAAGARCLASVGIGLGAEVISFEMSHRFLTSLTHEDHFNHNLWRWEGRGGLQEGLLNSLITFGTLKGAGRLAQGENVVVQHLLQDTGMVLGHQVSGALHITPRPTGSLAEQFLHAEATNLQLGAGMALAHTVAPGLQGIERGMDLSLRSIEIPPNQRGAREDLTLALAMAGDTGRRVGDLLNSAEPLMMASIKKGERDSPPMNARELLYKEMRETRILPEEEKRELIRGLQQRLWEARYGMVLAAREGADETLRAVIENVAIKSPEVVDQFVNAAIFFSKEIPFASTQVSEALSREDFSYRVLEYFEADPPRRTAIQRIKKTGSPEAFDAYVEAVRSFLRERERRGFLDGIQKDVRRFETALVRSDLPFLVSAARKRSARGYFLDLVQEGRMGLREGARRFDLNRTDEEGQPIKFLTYAWWWISQRMTRYLIDHGKNVRLPVNQMEKVNRLRRVLAEAETAGQSLEVSEIAEKLGIEEAKAHEVMALHRSLLEHSFEDPLKEGDSGRVMTRHDIVRSEAPRPDEEAAAFLHDFALRKVIQEFIAGLSRESDRRALEDYYLRDQGRFPSHLKRKMAVFLKRRGFAPEELSDVSSQETEQDSEPPPPPKAPQNGHRFRDAPPPPVPPPHPLPVAPVLFPQVEEALGARNPFPVSQVREVLRPRIAIVGFGAAGMGASHFLRQPQLITSSPDLFRPSLTVFEGMERPGGKIAPDNLGAQFADLFHFEPITTMIQRLGLKTYQIPDYDTADFMSRDLGLLKGEDFVAGVQILRRAAREALSQERWEDLDRQGAVDFIRHLFESNRLDPLQHEAMVARLGFEEGTTDVSALSYAFNLAKSATPMPRLEIEGGYNRLAEAEMSALIAAGGEVRLGTRLERLDVLSRGVQLYFNQGGNQGSEFFDFAILALSPEHLPFVQVNGSEIPLERIAALKPARITKTNLVIHGAPPGREIATSRYAKWFSQQPQRAITFFSGWGEEEPLPTSEMIEIAFGVHGEPVLRDIQSRSWDVRLREWEIPHGYTTMPRPGQGFEIFRLMEEQFFLGRYDKEPLKVANHVLGLGCYARDAALAGEWAAIALLRSMGLTLKPNAQRNRNPIKEFLGIDGAQRRRDETFPTTFKGDPR